MRTARASRPFVLLVLSSHDVLHNHSSESRTAGISEVSVSSATRASQSLTLITHISTSTSSQALIVLDQQAQQREVHRLGGHSANQCQIPSIKSKSPYIASQSYSVIDIPERAFTPLSPSWLVKGIIADFLAGRRSSFQLKSDQNPKPPKSQPCDLDSIATPTLLDTFKRATFELVSRQSYSFFTLNEMPASSSTTANSFVNMKQPELESLVTAHAIQLASRLSCDSGMHTYSDADRTTIVDQITRLMGCWNVDRTLAGLRVSVAAGTHSMSGETVTPSPTVEGLLLDALYRHESLAGA